MREFALMLPDHILAQPKAAAAEEQVSINHLFVALISEGLGHRRALHQHAARANVMDALHILDGAPDVPPDEGDERLP